MIISIIYFFNFFQKFEILILKRVSTNVTSNIKMDQTTSNYGTVINHYTNLDQNLDIESYRKRFMKNICKLEI